MLHDISMTFKFGETKAKTGRFRCLRFLAIDRQRWLIFGNFLLIQCEFDNAINIQIYLFALSYWRDRIAVPHADIQIL